jgi:effector-binding domain-containing protein
LVEQELRSQQLESAQPCVVVWHGDYRSEQPFTREVAMGFGGDVVARSSANNEVTVTELPSLEVASTVHYGSFEQFGQAYLVLRDWIEREGFVVNGSIREVYIHVDQNENKYVSELQIPVRKI